MRRVRVIWATALALVAGGFLAVPASSNEPGAFTVYVSTAGSDTNDGRTPGSAVATLEGAQKTLVAAQPRSDVEVRIAACRLGRTQPQGRVRYGGSANVPAHYGWGALDFVNSSEDTITGNHFVDLENSGTDTDLIHGVYLAHHSDHNVLAGNEFRDVSGDPDPGSQRQRWERHQPQHVRPYRTAGLLFRPVLRRHLCQPEYPAWPRIRLARQRIPLQPTDHRLRRHRYSSGRVFVGDNNCPGETGCDNHSQVRVRTWHNRRPGAAG